MHQKAAVTSHARARKGGQTHHYLYAKSKELQGLAVPLRHAVRVSYVSTPDGCNPHVTLESSMARQAGPDPCAGGQAFLGSRAGGEKQQRRKHSFKTTRERQSRNRNMYCSCQQVSPRWWCPSRRVRWLARRLNRRSTRNVAPGLARKVADEALRVAQPPHVP